MNDPLGLFETDSNDKDPLGLFSQETVKSSGFDKVNSKLLNAVKYAGGAALETPLSLLAPLPSMIAGGVLGYGSVVSDLLKGQKPDLTKAGQTVSDVQDWNFGLGSYKPQTTGGKAGAETLAKLFAAPGEAAGNYIGAPIGKALGNEELGRLSAQLPVDVAMNFLPLGGAYAGLKGGAKAVGGLFDKKPLPKSDIASKLSADRKSVV